MRFNKPWMTSPSTTGLGYDVGFHGHLLQSSRFALQPFRFNDCFAGRT